MGFTSFSTAAYVTVAALLVSILILRRWRNSQETDAPLHADYESGLSESARLLRADLAKALPESVISPKDVEAFHEALNSHWSQNECEAAPACFVRPRNVKELCTAVGILGGHFKEWKNHVKGDENARTMGLFAVRSGGHHHAKGAASTKGGVLIDLRLFNGIEISEDGKTVSFGAGLTWKPVFRALEKRGLAVVGARVEDVGVGGFALGSGYSFYSPQYGFAPSNIVSFEVVLASGTAVTASASTNTDLWRALKGGSNNFGIVTQFTARTLPATKIWSGFTYHLMNQADKAIAAFHDYVNRVTLTGPDSLYDEHACGPIFGIGYVQAIGISLMTFHMAHTKPPTDGTWPACYASSIKPLWKVWNTTKLRDHEGASSELRDTNPNGRRQAQCSTTILNDLGALQAAYAAWRDARATIKKENIKGAIFSIVLQPLLPSWANKGEPSPNIFGISPSSPPLVLVSFVLSYDLPLHDEASDALTRRAIEQIDAYAAEHGTGHRFRFMNYAGWWQDVIGSYGEENVGFLRGVSEKVDREGLFQRGCAGGFKLGMQYE